MQHNRTGRKLRRSTSHRLALFRNQLMSLVAAERIETTLMKAKELRPLIERVVTIGKNDSVAARRRVFRWVPDRGLVRKVFESLGPRFTDRPGGYTRILRLGRRRGDNAEEAIIEFVDFKFTAHEKGPRRESTMERARRSVSSRVETIRKDKPEDEASAGATAEKTAGSKSSPKKDKSSSRPSGKKSGEGKGKAKAAPKKEGKGKAARPARQGSKRGT
jgi:large subunit ribosomal protein L17